MSLASLTNELWNPPEYVQEVQQVVRAAENAGEADLLGVCRRSGGAFPTLVAQLAQTLPVGNGGYHDVRRPYPSPAQGEWYFTPRTCDLLARLLGTTPLLLGAPSVAEHLLNASLIDSSPWLRERFDLTPSIAVISTTVEEAGDLPACDSALIDPPWYEGAIEDWLRRASSAVRPGGTILIPLMGELTRPDGRANRRSVKAVAASIGAFDIVEGAVEYSTPLFEECAMAASGVHLSGPWRIADLIILINEKPLRRRATNHRPIDWKDYRLGDDIISVRQTPSKMPRCKSIGEDGITLDSVSRRHPLLRHANLWSSRSRIGRADNVDAAQRALKGLAAATDPGDESQDASYGRVLRAALLGAVEC